MLASLFIVLLEAQVALPATVPEFPFQFREGLIWIEVQTSRSTEPLNFLLDSGAGVSVLNLSAARRLDLRLGGKVAVHGVGSSTSGYWPQRLRATAGRVALPGDFLAVDLSALSDSCECRVDGLVGADFLNGRAVQIDFLSRKIRLLPSGCDCAGREILPLRMSKGALRVPVQINGRGTEWVRLDTGCASGLHWVTGKAGSENQERPLAVALSPISVGLTRARVRLGTNYFDDVSTELHSKSIFPGEAGLLGNGLLARFDSVIIDAKAGRLVLEKSSR